MSHSSRLGNLVRSFRRASLVVAAAGAIFVAACTLGDTPSNCVPGQRNDCTTDQGCTGHQICDDNGYRFGECICDVTPTQPPFKIDAGPDAPPPILVGAPCITDKDCGPNLFCLDAASKKIFKEGPANGICVADCAKDASICQGLDPTSTCRTFDDNGTTNITSDDIAYCTHGCTTGTTPSRDKCYGRHDMACIAMGTATTNGTCIPVCRNDRDCAPRFCDLASGLCADGPRTGDAIGSTCSVSTSPDSCVGYCNLSAATSFSECTGYCTNGELGCGITGNPPYDVACVTPGVSGGGWNGGDFGYCGKLCDCDKDCARADAVCSPLPGPQATALGHKGACRSATLAGGDARPGTPCAK